MFDATKPVSAQVIMNPNETKQAAGNKRFKSGTGVIQCWVRVSAYGDAGRHWRDQLSGKNKRKWGRLYIDVDRIRKNARRRDNLWAYRDHSDMTPAESAASNDDECPGAMFESEFLPETSDVMRVCASHNQALGRDMYNALAKAVREAMFAPKTFKPEDMQDWEVEFTFL
jgi:hypothetical protein